MDDTVHIEVEIIEFDAIGIGLSQIRVGSDSVDGLRQVFEGIHDSFTIFLCKPPKVARNSHGAGSDYQWSADRTELLRSAMSSPSDFLRVWIL